MKENIKTDLTVGGYIFYKDKVLLIHHKGRDLWLPVGGHIEKNETPDKALIREVKEETGLNIKILNVSDLPKEGNVKENLAVPFYVNVHPVGDHDHCCFFYICKATNPEDLVINKELKNFSWFSKDDLNKNYVPRDVKNQALKAFELFNNKEC